MKILNNVHNTATGDGVRPRGWLTNAIAMPETDDVVSARALCEHDLFLSFHIWPQSRKNSLQDIRGGSNTRSLLLLNPFHGQITLITSIAETSISQADS